ncbi:hypothetical protein [Aestuariibacter salexigens]|uniref:hypothetical protein n=1 Tax=Aestuariibacter salexigens TaxID=226010 RepID=UPI00042A5529|nr:hypothetical protein [Aestuariibacter salexigens]
MSTMTKANQFKCAGMGSVMKSAEALTQRADELYQGSNAFINGLLVRGEVVEAQLKARVATTRANFTSTLKGTNMIDQAFNSFLAKFGLVEDKREKKLDELSTKVDNLVEVVAKLAAMKAAEKRAQADKPAATAAKKPAAKKTTTRKAASTKTAATTKSATAASDSKPAAKATTTRKRAASASKTTTKRASTAKTATKTASKAADKPADDSKE